MEHNTDATAGRFCCINLCFLDWQLLNLDIRRLYGRFLLQTLRIQIICIFHSLLSLCAAMLFYSLFGWLGWTVDYLLLAGLVWEKNTVPTYNPRLYKPSRSLVHYRVDHVGFPGFFKFVCFAVFYRFTQQNLPAWKPAMTPGCVSLFWSYWQVWQLFYT